MRTAPLVALVGSFILSAGVTATPPASPAPGVVHIPAADVDAVFAKGGQLVKTDAYQVHAARRADPGPAEVHAHNTDIFYVLEGSATVVTGGTVVGGSEQAPGETRGTAIEGGQAHPLAKGDVLVIPAGTAHQLRAVNSALRYFVVKVTQADR